LVGYFLSIQFTWRAGARGKTNGQLLQEIKKQHRKQHTTGQKGIYFYLFRFSKKITKICLLA